MIVSKEQYEKLYNLDISSFIEKLDTGTGFKPSYLAWSSALHILSQHLEGYTWKYVRYWYDEVIDGFFVETSLEFDGKKENCQLPVLDNKFKPQGKDVRHYEVLKYVDKKKVWNKELNKYETITKNIEPVNSFDINYSYQRCLVKNIAMSTGLGLNLYFKEGVKQAEEREIKLQKQAEEKEIKKKAKQDRKALINNIFKDEAGLKKLEAKLGKEGEELRVLLEKSKDSFFEGALKFLNGGD